MIDVTAGIIILNKEAAVLAADSAITFFHEGVKACTNGRKVFQISDTVAMMVYGNYRFMGVPWETIVHLYRQTMDPGAGARAHAEGLMAFLDQEASLFPREIEERYLEFQLYAYLRPIAEALMGQEPRVAREYIRSRLADWNGKDALLGMDAGDGERLAATYKKSVDVAIDLAFEEMHLSKGMRQNLQRMAQEMMVKSPEEEVSTFITGLAFAGFGEREAFPSTVLLAVQGKLEGRARWEVLGEAEVDHHHHAAIFPLAEGNRALGLLQGIDPHLEALLMQSMAERLAALANDISELVPSKRRTVDRLVKQTGEAICNDAEDHMMEARFQPLQDIISVMCKQELARLAEEIIRLATFLSSVGATDSTVRGPLTVVTISKMDGMSWVD